jgi:hypothetical protein
MIPGRRIAMRRTPAGRALAAAALGAAALAVVTCATFPAPAASPAPSAGPASPGAARATPASPAAAAPAAPDLLPAERSTLWQPGVTYNGGIPIRTAVCASVAPSGDRTGAADYAAISKAIGGCPKGGVVALGAGAFFMPDNAGFFLKSHITIRGAVDPAGRPATKFLLSKTRGGSLFGSFNMGGPAEGAYVQPNPLTADGPLNAYAVQVAQNPGYVAGELVTVNQVYDSSLWFNAMHFGAHCAPEAPSGGGPEASGAADPCHAAAAGTEQARNMFSQWNRPIGQVAEIASVSGPDRSGHFTLAFTAPLHYRFQVSLKAQVVRHAFYGTPATVITAPDQWIGIENIYVSGGSLVALINTKYSWVKNCEAFDWIGHCIDFIRCFRCEERDSFIHQTANPHPGGGGYALAIDWQSADGLVENNIHWAANKVIVMRASGGGNVIAYNYFEDGFGAGYPTIPEAGLNASHFLGSHMELFEGNESWNMWGDEVWGNSLYITFFRNHATTLRRNVKGVTSSGSSGAPMNFDQDSGGRIGCMIATGHDWYSFLGNVIGYRGMPAPRGAWIYDSPPERWRALTAPAVWNIGIDQGSLGATQAMWSNTRARTLRHGNYDFGATRGAVWDPSIARRTLPSSLYLTQPPGFWKSWKGQQGTGPYGEAWPWVDGATGATYALLARAAFDAMLQAGTLF